MGDIIMDGHYVVSNLCSVCIMDIHYGHPLLYRPYVTVHRCLYKHIRLKTDYL